MISWIVGIVLILLSLAYGLLVMWGNMMSDAPTAQKTSAWPVWLGLLLGIGVIVGHHYGVW